MKGRRCTEKLALVPGGKLGYNKATQAKDLRWKKDVQMELFRRTLAGLLMLVVAVSVGICVQGKFIDADSYAGDRGDVYDPERPVL